MTTFFYDFIAPFYRNIKNIKSLRLVHTLETAELSAPQGHLLSCFLMCEAMRKMSHMFDIFYLVR